MTDFDRSFERATNVGLVFIIIALFALLIKFNSVSSKSKTFVTDKGQRITLTSDGYVDFTNTTLVSYDYITGDADIKFGSGEEKVYNLKPSVNNTFSAENVLNISGMTDKYSIIPGTDENITRCFVDYAINNRLEGHELTVVDYNNDSRELVYSDNNSVMHKLKLGITGFYNIDPPRPRRSGSDNSGLFTGFLIGHYLK